jgi:spartin
LTYGVTFPAQGYDKALPVLDSLLERYSHFSSPTLIHGDKAKEEQLKRNKEGGLYVTSKGMNILANRNNTTTDNTYGGMVIPPEKVASNGKKLQINEQNQAEFWKTMAPNVDDYGSSVARGIATGSGQIIKGIFWVRDSTVAQLDNGSIYMQSKLKANDKEHKVSPRVLRNLHRVRRMSRATDNVAKALLTGVLVTTGFFEGAIIKSRAGKKIFKLMPGEVALVSLDAFGKLFDAVDKTGRDVLQSTSLMTQNVVSHRFGEPAAKVAEETLATTGHVISTGWTVIRLRKALNPKDGAGGASRVTKTGMLKNVAKNKIMGGKK